MPPPRHRPSRPAADAVGVGARRAALRIVDAVHRRGEPMDQASHAAVQGLAPADRALAIAIAAESFRHQVALDAMIDAMTAEPLADDAKVRAVLRLALVQLLALGIAGHAVVATTLDLLQGGPRRLAHALLSRAQRDGMALADPPALPPECAARWQDAWGDSFVAAAESAWAAPPPLDLSFARAEAAETFPDGVSLAPRHRRLPRGGDVGALPGFADGGWWVQDLAASIPARLLGMGEGRAMLDLCAAPGGKTMQLAAAGWQVTAIDSSAKRLERLRTNLARTHLTAETRAANVMTWEPEAPVAAILLDAPCSATGIFRRHPDVLHRVGPRQIAELAELQAAMLARAAGWVQPGGTLVYATCSLERAEGEAQIAAFLSAHADWAIDPAHANELPAGIAPAPEGWVRTGPGQLADEGGVDGFFIARLRRAG